MEMGTGKSFCLLDEWQDGVAAGRWKHLLLVAPAGSVRNWYTDRGEDQVAELRKHLDPQLFRKVTIVAWGELSKKKTVEKLDRAIAKGGSIAMFINVEALSTRTTGANELAVLLLNSADTLMAVDESTTVKGDSKRTETVVSLGELAVARRIMTGLATPKSPLDLYWQYFFLDWRILNQRSPFGFKMRYAITRKTDFGGKIERKIDIVVGYRNEDELAKRIAPYTYRVLKQDCLDLEPKTYEIREVELTAQQRKMYSDMKDFCTAQLDEMHHVTATNVVTSLMRLHQIVVGYTVDDETKEIRDVPSNRIKAILEVLNDHDRKAIIWTTYTHELQKIAATLRETYGPRSVATFWGGNRDKRADEEKLFMSDAKCRFMVATQSAGGRGNNWVNADLAIYAANSYDLEHRIQSEDRCHRIGQTRAVTYVDLIAPNTVEERIVKALRRKIDLATLISGENYREWLI
jgi:hypothetical protein